MSGSNGRTVSLALVVKRLVEYAYTSLKRLLDVARTKSDARRKKELNAFLSATRHRFMGLLVLLQWAKKMRVLSSKSERLLEKLRERDMQLLAAPDHLFALHHFLRSSVKAPLYDIPSALEVLGSGTFRQIPALVSPGWVDPRVRLGGGLEAALHQLRYVVARRLFHSRLPAGGFSSVALERGKLQLRVGAEFSVTLIPFADEQLYESRKWLLTELQCYISSYATSSAEESNILEHQLDALKRIVQLEVWEAEDPFLRLYERLNHFSISLQLDILKGQALIFQQALNTPDIHLKHEFRKRQLHISYWDRKCSVVIAPRNGKLCVVHEPSLDGLLKHDDSAARHIDPTNLNLHALLSHIIAYRCQSVLRRILRSIADETGDDVSAVGKVVASNSLGVALMLRLGLSRFCVVRVDVADGSFKFDVSPQLMDPQQRAKRQQQLNAADARTRLALCVELYRWLLTRSYLLAYYHIALDTSLVHARLDTGREEEEEERSSAGHSREASQYLLLEFCDSPSFTLSVCLSPSSRLVQLALVYRARDGSTKTYPVVSLDDAGSYECLAPVSSNERSLKRFKRAHAADFARDTMAQQLSKVVTFVLQHRVKWLSLQLQLMKYGVECSTISDDALHCTLPAHLAQFFGTQFTVSFYSDVGSALRWKAVLSLTTTVELQLDGASGECAGAALPFASITNGFRYEHPHFVYYARGLADGGVDLWISRLKALSALIRLYVELRSLSEKPEFSSVVHSLCESFTVRLQDSYRAIRIAFDDEYALLVSHENDTYDVRFCGAAQLDSMSRYYSTLLAHGLDAADLVLRALELRPLLRACLAFLRNNADMCVEARGVNKLCLMYRERYRLILRALPGTSLVLVEDGAIRYPAQCNRGVKPASGLYRYVTDFLKLEQQQQPAPPLSRNGDGGAAAAIYEASLASLHQAAPDTVLLWANTLGDTLPYLWRLLGIMYLSSDIANCVASYNLQRGGRNVVELVEPDESRRVHQIRCQASRLLCARIELFWGKEVALRLTDVSHESMSLSADHRTMLSHLFSFSVVAEPYSPQRVVAFLGLLEAGVEPLRQILHVLGNATKVQLLFVMPPDSILLREASREAVDLSVLESDPQPAYPAAGHSCIINQDKHVFCILRVGSTDLPIAIRKSEALRQAGIMEEVTATHALWCPASASAGPNTELWKRMLKHNQQLADVVKHVASKDM